jgi:hypothetical protein
MRGFKRQACEGSGNKWFNARPHPSPLPRGEGGPVAASGRNGGAGTESVHGFNGCPLGSWLEKTKLIPPKTAKGLDVGRWMFFRVPKLAGPAWAVVSFDFIMVGFNPSP